MARAFSRASPRPPRWRADEPKPRGHDADAKAGAAARLARRTETAARTISIEVGMQNSGLGVVLARQHFASPLVAIPCAISSLTHSVMGSVLAAWWRRSAADVTSSR